MDPAADVTLRTAFALLFAVAASHKVRDPARFRATLADYRLLPAPFVWPAAPSSPWRPCSSCRRGERSVR